MNTLKALSILSLLAAGTAFGQMNTMTSTTSTAAMDNSQKFVLVNAATNINAPANPVQGGDIDAPTSNSVTILFMDGEAMRVTGVNGKTIFVERATDGTRRSAHVSGATVWVGPSAFYSRTDPKGSCVTATAYVIPVVSILTGNVFYCQNGNWLGYPNVSTGLNNSGRFTYSTVPVGSVAYASVGTDTTLVAGTLYCADVVIPRTITATGIAVLNGGTGTTDNQLVALYDAGGNLLANSAVAGALEATANIFQKRAFTATIALPGPAQYFACVQSNGNTGTLRTVAASTFIDVLTTSSTGAFGTVPATMTVPTTFTADKGPVAYLY